MSQPQHQWYQSFRKVLSLFSAKEVKTPLSFFFRVVSAVVLIVGVGGWFLDPSWRPSLLLGAGCILILLVIIVAMLAWYRPKNLVYGETGHRAETRFALGTEQEDFTESDLLKIPGTSNPTSAVLKKEA